MGHRRQMGQNGRNGQNGQNGMASVRLIGPSDAARMHGCSECIRPCWLAGQSVGSEGKGRRGGGTLAPQHCASKPLGAGVRVR